MMERMRRLRLERFLLIAVILVALYYVWEGSKEVSGSARVLDGDTLEIEGRRISLFAIDAPELGLVCKRHGEPYDCGASATAALARLVAGKTVRCEPVAPERYAKALSRCYVGEVDLGWRMVTDGWAVAARHFSNDYVAAEESARAAHRGMWQGTFPDPETWKRPPPRRPASETTSRNP